MEWGKTMLWVAQGSAAGLIIFFLLVVGVYVLVPLESQETALTLISDAR